MGIALYSVTTIHVSDQNHYPW